MIDIIDKKVLEPFMSKTCNHGYTVTLMVTSVKFQILAQIRLVGSIRLLHNEGLGFNSAHYGLLIRSINDSVEIRWVNLEPSPTSPQEIPGNSYNFIVMEGVV